MYLGIVFACGIIHIAQTFLFVHERIFQYNKNILLSLKALCDSGTSGNNC